MSASMANAIGMMETVEDVEIIMTVVLTLK